MSTYKCVCPATVSGGCWIPAVNTEMPANSSASRSTVRLQKERSAALLTTVTVLPCLLEAISFSGCSFNEGTVQIHGSSITY